MNNVIELFLLKWYVRLEKQGKSPEESKVDGSRGVYDYDFPFFFHSYILIWNTWHFFQVSVEVKMLTTAIENVYPMAVMTNFANVVPRQQIFVSITSSFYVKWFNLFSNRFSLNACSFMFLAQFNLNLVHWICWTFSFSLPHQITVTQFIVFTITIIFYPIWMRSDWIWQIV